MVSSDSESTEIEKKINVETHEDGVKVYQWTFPVFRWLYSFLPFPEVDDKHREILEKERGPLELEHQDVLVGLLIAYLYCSIIFCRSYAGVMGNAVTEDEDLDISTEDFSQMIVYVGIVYGCAKGIGGPIIDAAPTKCLIYILVIISAVCVSIWTRMPNLNGLIILACVNAIPQAWTWPSFSKLIYEWYTPKQYGRMFSFLSIGSRLGSAITSFVLGGLLTTFGWRDATLFSPMITIFGALVTFFVLRGEFVAHNYQRYEDAQTRAIKDRLEDESDVDFVENSFALLKAKYWRILSNGRFWFAALASAGFNNLLVFEGFISIYAGDVLDASSALGGMLAGAIPLGIVLALIISGWKTEQLNEEEKATVCIIMSFACLLVTIVLFILTWVLEDMGLDKINKEVSSFFVGFFLFLLGLFAGYPYYIPPAVFCVKFGGPDSGTVSSLLDVITSIISAIFVYIIGLVAEDHGWKWVWLAEIGFVSVSIFAYFQYYNLDLANENKEGAFFQIFTAELADIGKGEFGPDESDNVDKIKLPSSSSSHDALE